MSAKRSRSEQSCKEETVKITVHFPKDKDEWNFTSPEKWTASMRFNLSINPTFFHVWGRMKNWKLCLEGEDDFIQNLDMPLKELEGKKILAFPWNPEDKLAEEELNHECDKRSLVMVDAQIDLLAKAMEKREKARQLIRARISKFNR